MTVNAHPGVQPTRIAAIMQLTPSTITRLIEKMEAEGYLRRETSGRVTAVYSTARAKRLDSKLRAAWRRLYERYARALTPEFSQTLTRDIFAASETLQSPAANPAPAVRRNKSRHARDQARRA
jgi:DNA-binding MarR family transcriptional regulator